MRLLCHIAVCLFVLLLCASGASTATSGIQKYAAARNASDGLPRLETTVADEPNRLQPQDSVADKADDEHREQEERVGMTVEPWTSSAGHFLEANELLMRQQMHLNRALAPSMHDEEVETVFARVNLQQWLSNSHKPDHVEAFPVASGSVLITNGRGGGVAKVFLWLRGFAHQKDFAEMWQRILLAHYPETLPLVSEVWLKSGLSPTEAYRMMPVSAKETYGWLDVHRTINDWIDYVDKYRSLGHDYSDSQVVRVLAKDRHANTLEEIFNWLRITLSKKDDADRMQKSLELLQVLNRWIKLGVSPDQAYVQSLNLVNFRFLGADGEASDWAAFLSEFQHWLTLIDVYRSLGNDFIDKQVIESMMTGRTKHELMKIFLKLRNVPGMKNRADILQRCLLSEQNMLGNFRATYGVWLESGVHPTEVYRILFGPATTSNMPTVVITAAEWLTICRTLEFWIRYGDDYRLRIGKFDDDQVVDVLRKNRHEKEVVDFFTWLRDEKEMKDRADRMQRRLIWGSHDQLGTLKLTFDAWLRSSMHPLQVYHIMFVPATERHTAAAERMADWPTICGMLKLWFEHIELCRSRGIHFDDAEAVDVLRYNRHEEEVVKFFNWLRDEHKMKRRADRMQRRMILLSPNLPETLKLAFPAWLRSRRSPTEVYHMMVPPLKSRVVGTAGRTTAQPDIISLLMEWLEYVRIYRKRVAAFNDARVVRVLERNEKKAGALHFLDRLQRVRGKRRDADILQRHLRKLLNRRRQPHSTV